MSTNRYPLRLIIVGLLMTLASLGLYSTLVQAVDNPASVDSPGETLAPEISLLKTVGSDPNVCATADNLAVPPGSQVTYCYEVTNTGNVALSLHTLQDSQLGTILNDFAYTLVPGASAFLTQTHTITGPTLNTATWTAYNPGPTDIVTATASATVEVFQPGISLSKTVGTDPHLCAATDNIAVLPGTQVTYCYEVTNTGGVALSRHTLQDSQLGAILDDFPYTLTPAASAFITQTQTITETTLNTATWTAYNPGPTDIITATASATVEVFQPGISLSKTVSTDPNVCAATDNLAVPPGSQVTYCYEVTNTGGVALSLHTLQDSQLGTILNDFAYSLVPGASVFLTQTQTITETTLNTATWTAYNPGPMDETSAEAQAMVIVTGPGLDLYLPLISR